MGKSWVLLDELNEKRSCSGRQNFEELAHSVWMRVPCLSADPPLQGFVLDSQGIYDPLSLLHTQAAQKFTPRLRSLLHKMLPSYLKNLFYCSPVK